MTKSKNQDRNVLCSLLRMSLNIFIYNIFFRHYSDICRKASNRRYKNILSFPIFNLRYQSNIYNIYSYKNLTTISCTQIYPICRLIF